MTHTLLFQVNMRCQYGTDNTRRRDGIAIPRHRFGCDRHLVNTAHLWSNLEPVLPDLSIQPITGEVASEEGIYK